MAVAKWTVWVEARQPNGSAERVEIGAIGRDLSSPGPDDLGLQLAEAKDLLRNLQSHLAQEQVRLVGAAERNCRSCGSKRFLRDYRQRKAATLFGQRPSVRQAICNTGAKPILPPKDPQDLNPIEMVFAKLRHLLRHAAARTRHGVCVAIETLLDAYTPNECANGLRDSGYGRA